MKTTWSIREGADSIYLEEEIQWILERGTWRASTWIFGLQKNQKLYRMIECIEGGNEEHDEPDQHVLEESRAD